MSEEHKIGELVKAEAQDMIRQASRQLGKTKTMLFLSTPSGVRAIKHDPVAADRAKRYLWSRIERNQTNDWRAE